MIDIKLRHAALSILVTACLAGPAMAAPLPTGPSGAASIPALPAEAQQATGVPGTDSLPDTTSIAGTGGLADSTQALGSTGLGDADLGGAVTGASGGFNLSVDSVDASLNKQAVPTVLDATDTALVLRGYPNGLASVGVDRADIAGRLNDAVSKISAVMPALGGVAGGVLGN